MDLYNKVLEVGEPLFVHSRPCLYSKLLLPGKRFEYLNNKLNEYDNKSLIEYRRFDVGFVFQFYNLVQNLTAVENVETNATRFFKNGNQLTVECEYAINRLYLVDMTGKVLVNQQCSMTNETTVMLPQSGVFVLFLETTQGYVAHKIVNN